MKRIDKSKIAAHLPFKVKRTSRPRIVFKKKRPTSTEVGVVAEYSPITHRVAVYHKKPSKFDIEHEVAHYQLTDRRKLAEKSLVDEIEEEIQADLIASTKAKIPKDYLPILQGHASSAMFKLQDWEVTRLAKADKVFGFIEKAIKKYWEWLPEQWRKSYKIFVRNYKERRMQAKGAGRSGIGMPSVSKEGAFGRRRMPRITPKTPRLRR